MSTLIDALARASDDFANFAHLINLLDWRFSS
jgi:hypothetical protein